ncbi:MAG TPA: PEGA domain-containing protein [Chitinophagaceae bacterium]
MKSTLLLPPESLLVLTLLFSHCASIVSRTSYPVHIHSSPDGATVSITDKKSKEVFKGQSPATVTLKSGAGYFAKAEYQVRISAPGYAEQVIPVNYRLNGWYFGNLLLGGVLGMLVVDPITGAMWRLDTPEIFARLQKTTAFTEEPMLRIMDIKDVPQELRGQLERVK